MKVREIRKNRVFTVRDDTFTDRISALVRVKPLEHRLFVDVISTFAISVKPLDILKQHFTGCQTQRWAVLTIHKERFPAMFGATEAGQPKHEHELQTVTKQFLCLNL